MDTTQAQHAAQHEDAKERLADAFHRLYGQYAMWPSAAKELYNAERKTLYILYHGQHKDFEGTCLLRTCPLSQAAT